MYRVSIITPTTPERIKLYAKLLVECAKWQSPDAYNLEIFEWLTDDQPGSIGAKRNRLCQKAQGDIIVHFDDDDWYREDYIKRAVAYLILSKADVTGLSTAWFHNAEQNKAWLYEYKGKQPYVIGSGMVYWRSVWERNHFLDISHGEDMHFLTHAGHISPHGYTEGFYANIHGNNTASHQIIPVIPERPITEFNNIFKIS